MPSADSPVTATSSRLARSDRLALIAVSLAIVLIGLLISLGLQAIRMTEQNIALQFRDLEGAFREQERFLIGWRLHESDAASHAEPAIPPDDIDPALREILPAWSMVEASPRQPTDQASVLGARFVQYYREFWSQSRYRPSQCLLVDGMGRRGLLAPVKQVDHADGRAPPRQFETALQRIRHAAEAGPRIRRGYVGWASEPWIDGQTRYIGVATVPEDAPFWGQTDTGPDPAIACILDTDTLLADVRASESPVFTSLSIFTPAGTRLLGQNGATQRGPARRLSVDGLELRMQGKGGWTAVYNVAPGKLLFHARGPVLAGSALALVVALFGGLLFRSSRRQIVGRLHRQQARLLESEAFSRVMLDNAPIGICLIRISDGSVMLDNRHARRLLGGDHGHGAWIGTWRDAVMARPLEQDPAGIAFTTTEQRHLLVVATPTRFDAENVVLCLFMDQTVQHDAELAMQRAQQASDQANQAKTQFLATISHEIRTPLYGVLGTLELLGLTKLDPRQREHLRTIDSSSSSLMGLIDDILDVSKAEAGELHLNIDKLDPERLTEDLVVAWTGAARNKGLQCYALVETEVPDSIAGDAARVRQILNNLLSNAIKYTESGRVVVRLSVESSGAGNHLRWQVSDTGIGISSEHQPKLFERFYQVREERGYVQGAGLGLAIATRLAGMMDGQLTVTSERGLGSSFVLRLPLPVQAGSEATGPRRGAGNRGDVVLHGEPGDLVQNLAERLARRGYRSTVARLANAAGADPGAVRLDILGDVHGSPVPHDGPQVVASALGGDRPEHIDGYWLANANRLDAITAAVDAALEIALPLAASDLQLPHQKLAMRVLVVEDHPINQSILRTQLEAFGCTVVVAGDGLEALSLCAHQSFSLVLTDLNMPRMDGVSLVSALRQKGIAVPVYGTSADADPAERERCVRAGMRGLLIKPIMLKSLQDILRSLPAAAGDEAGEPPLPHLHGAIGGTMLERNPALLPLFLQTMDDDIVQLREALNQGAVPRAVDHLHRISGALAVVPAFALATRGHQTSAALMDASSEETDAATDLAWRFVREVEAFLVTLHGGAPSSPGT